MGSGPMEAIGCPPAVSRTVRGHRARPVPGRARTAVGRRRGSVDCGAGEARAEPRAEDLVVEAPRCAGSQEEQGQRREDVPRERWLDHVLGVLYVACQDPFARLTAAADTFRAETRCCLNPYLEHCRAPVARGPAERWRVEWECGMITESIERVSRRWRPSSSRPVDSSTSWAHGCDATRRERRRRSLAAQPSMARTAAKTAAPTTAPGRSAVGGSSLEQPAPWRQVPR